MALGKDENMLLLLILLLVRSEIGVGVQFRIPVVDIVVMGGEQPAVSIVGTDEVNQSFLQRLVPLVEALLREIPDNVGIALISGGHILEIAFFVHAARGWPRSEEH